MSLPLLPAPGAPARTPFLAHAFGQRYDLPIPLALFVVGGAAVVVVSFLLVFRRGVAPTPDADVGTGVDADRVPAARVHPVRAALSLLGLLALVVVGLTGDQSVADNILPTTFWVTVWIVVPLSCGVLGNWTAPVNPFAVLSALGDSARARRVVLARDRPLEWTAQWWPAVALFTLIVLGELVFNLSATVPSFIAAALLLYAGLCLVAGLLFGAAWQQHGEVFSVLFDVWGRQGLRRFGAPGPRGFAGGLQVPFEAGASRVVFVLLMLVNINFDGLSATRRWTELEQSTVGAAGPALQGVKTLSLLVLVLVALAAFGLLAAAATRAGGRPQGLLASLAGLLPSLVPIAFGYLVAHYCSYVVTNLQLYGPLLGNPGYPGWPLHLPHPFNDTAQVDLTLLPAAFYWYLSLTAIVLAHVAAVLLAHRHLAGRARDERRARASEYPWLLAMVAYTVFSLLLIGQTEAQDTSGSSSPAGRPSAAAPADRPG